MKDFDAKLQAILTHIDETGAFPVGGTDAEILVQAAYHYLRLRKAGDKLQDELLNTAQRCMELESTLRDHALEKTYHEGSRMMHCAVCDREWPYFDDEEKHAFDCPLSQKKSK